MGHYTQRPKAILAQLVLSLLLLVHGPSVLGHHPHDMIDALSVSPSYTEDNTLYIANAGHLLRSTSGGYSWDELVYGLDNLYPISSIETTRSQNGSLNVFVATLGDGIYRSTDGGNSWTSLNTNISNLAIRSLSVRQEGTILAIDINGKLNVSTDNGASWHLARLPDNAHITSVSPMPSGSRILAGDVSGAIYLSADNGSNWTFLGQIPANTKISVIAFNPSDSSGSSFFIGTSENGLYKSSDNGASFKLLDNGLHGTHITSLAFSSSYKQDRTLFASTWRDAVFVSTDEGNTWNQYDHGLTTSVQADTAKYNSPHFREVKTVNGDRKILFLAGFDGLFKSMDQGNSWEGIETLSVSLIKSLDVSPGTNNGAYSIAIGTYGGGAYISHNKGESWTIGNKGLNTTRIGDIKFSLSYPDDDTLFSGSLGLMLKSENRGKSWENTDLDYNSLRKRVVNKLISLGLPKDIGHELLEKRDLAPVYPNTIAISPNYALDNTIFVGTRYHGLYLLNTDSMEFNHVWEDATAAITTIALSPQYSSDRTAFLFVRGDSLYKSTDSGTSWQRISNGLPFKSSRDNMTEIFTHKDMKIVFSPLFSKDQTLFAAGPMGIFKSTDGGDSWNAIEDSSLGSNPNIQALGISPDFPNDKILLVSLKGLGLFRSIDGGSSFSKVGNMLIENNQAIELVAFSNNFQHDQTIYAASDQDLFISSDQGDNWTLLSRPVRYEDRRDDIKYTGNWTSMEGDEFSASTVHYSETPGDRAKLNFDGCGIRWITTKSPKGGIVNVYIDNSLAQSVDLHSASVENMSEVFIQNDLTCGPHTINIELPETGNTNSQRKRVTLDAFDVLPPS